MTNNGTVTITASLSHQFVSFFSCSIKKKVKGGPSNSSSGPGPSSGGGNQCKTLPNSSNNPLMAQHAAAGPKFPKGVGAGVGDAATAGEAISSAIVKYNYQAQQLDELSLVKGARILILEKSGDGWWRGQHGNKIGWFPSNYTQVLKPTNTQVKWEL